MIKLFRKIRQNLLSQNKLSKYLIYAIGEIILVVIGILIAIQINNLNENKKLNIIAHQYLKGIETDLKKDITQIDSILNRLTLAVGMISSVENIYKGEFYKPNEYNSLFNNLDTSKTNLLFYRGMSFRANRGTYNSLISDGKTGIIKDRELYQKIQEIYDELNPRISSTYENLKEIEGRIWQNYPFQKKTWNYSDLKNSTNDKIFLDLSNFTEEKYFYAQNLYDLKIQINKTLELLEHLNSEKIL
ncbi:DUF6090 family protein [Aegicerativicinus sediminis]|uniref:DUF6090 family protein n=1 Tax=Aegicerativicinus sediminis TaxID=2893202 RepID=UPI001E5AEEF4|nr:DUF6090 family protein [Aegicerativicinus sediminis]